VDGAAKKKQTIRIEDETGTLDVEVWGEIC